MLKNSVSDRYSIGPAGIKQMCLIYRIRMFGEIYLGEHTLVWHHSALYTYFYMDLKQDADWFEYNVYAMRLCCSTAAPTLHQL